MRDSGLDDNQIAELASKKGYTMPAKKSLMKKAGDVVGGLFAGKKVGEAIGTLGGYGLTKASEATGLPIAPGGGKYGFHQAQKGESEMYDLSAPTPTQVLGDVALGAAQVAGAKMPIAGTIPGKVAQFGALGAVSGASEEIAGGGTLKDAAKEAISDGIKGALIGATFGVIEKGLTKGTEVLNKAGEKIQMSVIKPSAHDVSDGFKIDTIQKYNLGGSLQETFKKSNAKLTELGKELNKKLGATKATVDMNDVYDATTKRLLGNNLENFGASGKIGNALEQLRGEIVNTVGKNGVSTLPEAQVIKRAAGHFGAWKYGITDPDSVASEKVYNVFYNELKKAIEKSSPEGVAELNKQMSEIIPVLNAVIRRIPVAERNAGISLTDIITLTGGALEPSVLSLSLINRASKSGVVGNALRNVKGIGQGVVGKAEQVTQSLLTR